MPKIDKEALYNHLASRESALIDKLLALPSDTGDDITQRLLTMRELNTVSQCKFLVYDFPELPEEGGTHEQS